MELLIIIIIIERELTHSTWLRSWLFKVQTPLLTQYGQDHDDKVKQVPGLDEIVVSQSEYLEKALGGENNDEDGVQVVQDAGEELSLLVVIHGHGQHV